MIITTSNTVAKTCFVILCAIAMVACNVKKNGHYAAEAEEEAEEGRNKQWASQARYEQELEQTVDPKLGYIPLDRLVIAKNYADQIIAQAPANLAIANVTWRALGPNNQGGRSRSMLVDANDATGKTVFIASVGGGLYKTTDITVANPNWVAVNNFFGNLAITCIAQDPSNANILYFGTGEMGYNNADATRGGGIWKSTDGGATFSQLSSTTGLQNCLKIAVTSTGTVLAATTGGLQRSTNGGTSFTKVLGVGLATGANHDKCYDVDVAANGDVYASVGNYSQTTNLGTVHKSTNGGATFGAALPIGIANAGRIEIALAPNDANYVYVLAEAGTEAGGIALSTNGGTSFTVKTEPDDADTGIDATDFTRGQAWYDLTIVVSPTDKNTIMVGGIDLFKSTNGGTSWTQISHWYGGFGYQNVHADQHFIYYDPTNANNVYFLNDGGIYRATNATATTPTIIDKGNNYVTTQFYACAIHPTANTNYYLAGAQDNGSHRFTQGVMQPTTEVTGGDGAFCHIDQNEPNNQFTAYVYNDYYRSTNGGASFTNVTIGTANSGNFINPTDYDDANNVMYCGAPAGGLYRWSNPTTGNTYTTVSFGAVTSSGRVTNVKVAPTTNHRVYVGTNNGFVIRIDAANATPTVTNIKGAAMPGSTVSCIEVEPTNENHIVVTYSNYGVNSVWETTDGGTNWTSIEGNLPDMPIRWALFNPNNTDQLLLATELGIWSTDNINGTTTDWGTTNNGLANVRINMLQYRTSDKKVIAATYGKGLYVTSAFTPPAADFLVSQRTTYAGVPLQFTNASDNSNTYTWAFGDGTTSTAENPAKTYATPGTYNVTLTINGGAATKTINSYIQILPRRGTPYTTGLGGNFDVSTGDFGVNTTTGTAWERGNSTVAGKNNTYSGANAWVTGLTGNYADNTESYLLTPNFNFLNTTGAAPLYTLSFYAKRSTENGYDGFRVEYSTDSGRSWLPLGTSTAAGWYNFANTTAGAAFPVNQAFFSGAATTYALYSYNASFLAGTKAVAFRFAFKADASAVAAGVAIDDFQITGTSNILALQNLQFGAQVVGTGVLLNWSTTREDNIDKYTVERSTNGINFTPIATHNARNSSNNFYTSTDNNINSNSAATFYYRLKIVTLTNEVSYSTVAKVNFTTPIIVDVTPNPTANLINISAQQPIKQVHVYNNAGALLQVVNNTSFGGTTLKVNTALLPHGSYFIKAIFTNGSVASKQVVVAN
jgi:hypothetical protein